MSKTVVADESSDKKYFIITPQLVWALCRDPYDLALWTVIKMIAGENGKCYIGDRQLAKAAMMSVGKAHECRQHLMDIGLLRGYLKKRENTKHPVWHLSIPDIWEENIRWRKTHDRLSARLAFKKQLKEELSAKGSWGEPLE